MRTAGAGTTDWKSSQSNNIGLAISCKFYDCTSLINLVQSYNLKLQMNRIQNDHNVPITMQHP